MLKRFVLLLQLVIMPFQVTWAAPNGYCLHEQGNAVQHHFGHHAHQHQDGKFKGKAPSTGIDDDCAYCHLGGAILPPAAPSIAAATLPSINFSFFLEAMSSVPAREPERPKWTLAA